MPKVRGQIYPKIPLSPNPFFGVIESDKFKASRLYRRTFFEKLIDTFYVLAGKRAKVGALGGSAFIKNLETRLKLREMGYVTRKEHLGLLDYATFQLTRAVNKVAHWAVENCSKDPLALLLLIPASLLFVAFNLAHYAAAVGLTIAAFVPVLLVHIGSEIAGGYKLKEEAGKLRVLVGTERGLEFLDENLEQLSDDNGWTYSTISLALVAEQPFKNLLLNENNRRTKDWGNEGVPYPELFFVDLDNLTANDKKAIRALIELNASGLYDSHPDRPNLYEELADDLTAGMGI